MNKRILLLLFVSTSLAACSHIPSWMGGGTEAKPKLAGERKVALAVDSKLVADAEVKNIPPVLPKVTANDSWAQNNGNFSAATGNLSGGTFTSKSSAEVGNGNNFTHSLIPRPVVSGGTVFVMDSAGVISAHNSVDISKVKFVSKAIADSDEHDVVGGGLAVDGGVLYAATGQGQIAALNAVDGKGIWQKNYTVPLRGAPRVSGDRIVVMTIDSQTYGLSSKTGEISWVHRGIDETAVVMNSVSPAISGDDVLIPYSSGELFALSATDGKELWGDVLLRNKHTEAATAAFTGIGGDPVLDGVVAFVAGSNGITAAMDTSRGQRIWQVPAGSINTPWLAGDELYLLTTDNVLVDLVKYTGKIRWATALESYDDPDDKQDPINWRGPVLVDGKLFVVGSNGKMAVVSAANGKILEKRDIPDNIMTAPVVAGGRLYLVDQDANLYSFQ
jgi:outer membrane protein assembly factor BamB